MPGAPAVKRLLLTTMLVATAVTVCLWNSDWLAQDHCLDSGGRWSAAIAACEH